MDQHPPIIGSAADTPMTGREEPFPKLRHIVERLASDAEASVLSITHRRSPVWGYIVVADVVNEYKDDAISVTSYIIAWLSSCKDEIPEILWTYDTESINLET